MFLQKLNRVCISKRRLLAFFRKNLRRSRFRPSGWHRPNNGDVIFPIIGPGLVWFRRLRADTENIRLYAAGWRRAEDTSDSLALPSPFLAESIPALLQTQIFLKYGDSPPSGRGRVHRCVEESFHLSTESGQASHTVFESNRVGLGPLQSPDDYLTGSFRRGHYRL